MKRASTINRGLIWRAALLFALSACAAAPSQTATLGAPELHARAINAAQTDADPAAQPDYLLDAAERFFRGNFIEQAKSSLRALPATLSSQQYTRRQSLYAAIALTEHNPRAALAALKDAVRDDTPPDQRVEVLQLRAAAATQSGNVLDGMRSRAALAPLLGDAEAARRNEQALWQALISLLPDALTRLAAATPADALNGWAALALIAKTADTTAAETEQRIADWRTRYPRHPASASVIANLAGAAPDNGDRSTNIALLLPLSGTYGQAAAAVRDGFLAAYFADRQQNSKTRIRIYDSADKSAAVPQLYARALADGAELVVGPLAKEAVSALRQSGNLTVPTLALNYSDDDGSGPANLYQFGLAPEDDAHAVAERAWLDGRTRALIITPAGEWGSRVMRAFSERWQQLGGRVVAAQTYESNGSDLSTPLRRLLNIDASEARAKALRAALQTDIKFEPRRRQDADLIFMAAFPRQARQIPAQLKFFYAGDLPLYATSHIYDGIADAGKDRDLDGILFPDMPWLLDQDSDPLRAAIEQAWPEQTGLQRLYALGVDAYRLAPRLMSASRAPQGEIAGATGRLLVGPDHRVRRTLLWARFNKGEPVPLPAVPTPIP